MKSLNDVFEQSTRTQLEFPLESIENVVTLEFGYAYPYAYGYLESSLGVEFAPTFLDPIVFSPETGNPRPKLPRPKTSYC